MLGLKVRTDARWARDALGDVDALLVDHAHCEMKAASNALSLVARHPHDLALVAELADLAREEIEHFKRVVAILAERGAELGAPAVDVYAAELRRAASASAGSGGAASLVDRLLVGALIEARSCERFKLLAGAVADHPDASLHGLWRELLAAEARHYATFVELAVRAAAGDRPGVMGRLDELADAEGRIVARLAAKATDGARSRIHG